ncbi:MAG: DUF480 domain-containing protein [Nitrospirae bacterium]|nr:DUF480 domain-containing protein [Candidatus Manganitrophaceae bacterium]
MMEIILSETEIRVLGALMEKELTTPDHTRLLPAVFKCPQKCLQSNHQSQSPGYL